MALMRWDPVGELLAIRDRMNRLLEETVPRLPPDREERRSEEWTPQVDILQNEEGIVVRAEVPGVDLEDVLVEVKGDVLTLQGERKLDERISRQAYRRIERPYGFFRRSFTLPRGIDQEKIRARLKNGVLEVVLPLSTEPSPKAIDVRVE